MKFRFETEKKKNQPFFKQDDISQIDIICRPKNRKKNDMEGGEARNELDAETIDDDKIKTRGNKESKTNRGQQRHKHKNTEYHSRRQAR